MKNLLFLLCISVSPLYAQDINQGLIGHWLLNDEDDLYDQSDSQLDGVVASGVYTEDRFGNEDEAIFFDGQFDYAVFEDAFDDVTTAEDASFSISLWHQTSDFIPDLSPLICKYSHSLCGEAERQWALLIAAGEGIRFYFAGSPDNLNYRSISTLPAVANNPNTWYHIVATYDGSQDGNDGLDRVQIYVDNMLIPDTVNFSIGNMEPTIYDGEAPIGLMSYVSIDQDQCGEFNAPGALDDLRIYDRVITSAEVDLLFNEGVVSVDEQEAFSSSISISPTLVENGQVTIRIEEIYTDMRFEVLTLDGKLVQTEILPDFQGSRVLNLNSCSAGAYLLRLSTSSGLQHTEKLIID